MRPPTIVTEKREFTGLCGSYRKFVKRFSDTIRPIIRFTKKNVPFGWTEEFQYSFECCPSLSHFQI